MIDVSALVDRASSTEAKQACAKEIDKACRESGFFRITGHGVPHELLKKLDRLSRDFFNLPTDEKEKISMKKAGAAWKGWFPVFGELTSGKPDGKEGLYCARELPDDHPKVVAKVPLHGKNQFPEHPAELGPTILQWFDYMSELGKTLLRGVALGLGMPEDWFANNICKDPTE